MLVTTDGHHADRPAPHRVYADHVPGSVSLTSPRVRQQQHLRSARQPHRPERGQHDDAPALWMAPPLHRHLRRSPLVLQSRGHAALAALLSNSISSTPSPHMPRSLDALQRGDSPPGAAGGHLARVGSVRRAHGTLGSHWHCYQVGCCIPGGMHHRSCAHTAMRADSRGARGKCSSSCRWRLSLARCRRPRAHSAVRPQSPLAAVPVPPLHSTAVRRAAPRPELMTTCWRCQVR